MNVFTTLLAKDLREQRLSLLAPWGLGLLACAATAVLVDPSWLDTPVFAQVLALTLGSLCALAIGCDVGSRERGEGSLSWLLRQPFGFGQVIVSKLAVLLLGMFFGLCAGALFAYVTSASVAAGGAAFGFGRTEGVLVLIVIALGLWTTSASTWMPRGFLAAPAGIVSFVLVAAPAWIPIVWYELRPDTIVWKSLVLALPLGGLFAAIAGLSTGVRTAAGPARRASWALGAGALGCVPLWFTATQQTLDVLRFDPTTEAFHVGYAHLGADGRHAILNVSEGRRDWRRNKVDSRPIRVDLETGAWSEVGPRGSFVREGVGTDALLLEDATGILAVLRDDGTRVPLDELPLRSWLDDGHTIEPPDELRLVHPAGLGWSVCSAGKERFDGYFDPRTGAVFSRDELRDAESDSAASNAYATNGSWLVMHADPRGRDRHALYDPDLGELSRPAWLDALQGVLRLTPDGRVLAMWEAGGEFVLVLVDVRKGAWMPLTIRNAPELHLAAPSIQIAANTINRLHDPASEPVLITATTRDRRHGWLWFREDERGPHLLWSERPRSSTVGGRLGQDELLVSNDGALWAYRFDGRAPRKLFPR